MNYSPVIYTGQKLETGNNEGSPLPWNVHQQGCGGIPQLIQPTSAEQLENVKHC
jgi:hypothetical protein